MAAESCPAGDQFGPHQPNVQKAALKWAADLRRMHSIKPLSVDELQDAQEKPARRVVVHISDYRGPRGGEGWLLRLSCWHSEMRRKPRLGPAGCFGRGSLLRPAPAAPGCVRCLMCETLALEMT